MELFKLYCCRNQLKYLNEPKWDERIAFTQTPVKIDNHWRHDWVSKVIHLEICKKFKFVQNNKWYMHNPAVLENDTHKLLWDFDIHTDHLISARRPDLIIINKKKRT